jgi:hypothetical protein
MADVLRPRGEESPKLIHSTALFFAVPLGLCGLAMAIHWLIGFIP